MKISKIQLMEYRKPFKVGFHSPQVHRRAAESIFLKLVFSNGRLAFGECAPRDYVTGENCQTVIEIIRDVFAPVLFDVDLASLEDVIATLEKIETYCFSCEKRPYLSALAAVDLALLDAIGQQTHSHISNVIGRQSGHKVTRSISVPFLPTDIIETLFNRLQNTIPFDAVKVLMKNDLEENVQRVAFIRGMIGPEMPLRIEANGKWSYREAIEHIDALLPFKITSIEEPIDEPKPERLRQLRNQIDIDIILDESVCSQEDAQKMLIAEACDGFNLKLSKCGGLLKLMAIADLAQENHLKCQLGTHVGEGPVLEAAGLYAASSHSVFNNYEGYSSLLFLDLSKETTCLRNLAKQPIFQGFGLGIDTQDIEPMFDSSHTIELSP